MRIFWLVVPLLCFAVARHVAAQTVGTPACTNSEVAAINEAFQEGFSLGYRIGAGAVPDVMGAMMAYSQRYDRMKKGLPAPCGTALAKLEQALQQQQKRRNRASQAPSILYDRSSDTYHAPGLASCGPSGCILY